MQLNAWFWGFPTPFTGSSSLPHSGLLHLLGLFRVFFLDSSVFLVVGFRGEQGSLLPDHVQLYFLQAFLQGFLAGKEDQFAGEHSLLQKLVPGD